MPNEYGYFYGKIDAPQRFGDDSIFAFDWGDSEIRYTWRAITVGFGTEYLWLGPSYMNAVLHSNHAAAITPVLPASGRRFIWKQLTDTDLKIVV